MTPEYAHAHYLLKEGMRHEGFSSWALERVLLQALPNQVHKLRAVVLT